MLLVYIYIIVVLPDSLFRYPFIFSPLEILRNRWNINQIFRKSTLSDKENKKWKQILVADIMSSEESASDEMFLVKRLPWRSERVTQFLKQLDDRQEGTKKAQAKRQRKQRVHNGISSSRPLPLATLPPWSLVSDQ